MAPAPRGGQRQRERNGGEEWQLEGCSPSPPFVGYCVLKAKKGGKGHNPPCGIHPTSFLGRVAPLLAFIPRPFWKSVGEKAFSLFPPTPIPSYRIVPAIEKRTENHRYTTSPITSRYAYNSYSGTYIRTEPALKLIIVSDTVQWQCTEKPARSNSGGLSICRVEG